MINCDDETCNNNINGQCKLNTISIRSDIIDMYYDVHYCLDHTPKNTNK